MPAETERVSPVVAQLLQRACLTLDRDAGIAKREIQRALALLLDTVVQAEAQPAQVRQPIQGLAPWQAQRVIDHVRANFDTPIRVEKMASMTQLSTSYFFRAFKLSFRMSPHAYVTRLRLARARELLLESPARISQIAATCGFADQAHFSRVFRREMGCAPGLWRREQRSLLVT